MATTIEWGTKVITVLQADMFDLGGGIWEFDIDAFRLDLGDLLDDEEGMPFPDTHRHNTEVTISGVTYARTVELINGYTVTISPATAYQVSCTGANHNVQDVLNNTTGPTFLPNNAAGLISSGVSGLTTAESIQLDDLHATHMNKRVADPSTGIETVYETDGATPRHQFDLFKDIAETDRYDGVDGIAVRDPI